MRLSQVSSENYNDVSCIRSKAILGTVDGTVQTKQDGWKDSKKKPKEISIFDETVTLKSINASKTLLSVNCFATVEKYFLLLDKLTMAADNNKLFCIRQSPVNPLSQLVPRRAS